MAMQYWVYGIDRVTNEPRDPLFIEASSEADARAQAQELGMLVEAVETVSSKPGTADPSRTRLQRGDENALAAVLVTVFRVLAGIVALLYVILIGMIVSAASDAAEIAGDLGGAVAGAIVQVILDGLVTVSFLLAIAELLRLGVALERNTRARDTRNR